MKQIESLYNPTFLVDENDNMIVEYPEYGMYSRVYIHVPASVLQILSSKNSSIPMLTYENKFYVTYPHLISLILSKKTGKPAADYYNDLLSATVQVIQKINAEELEVSIKILQCTEYFELIEKAIEFLSVCPDLITKSYIQKVMSSHTQIEKSCGFYEIKFAPTDNYEKALINYLKHQETQSHEEAESQENS